MCLTLWILGAAKCWEIIQVTFWRTFTLIYGSLISSNRINKCIQLTTTTLLPLEILLLEKKGLFLVVYNTTANIYLLMLLFDLQANVLTSFANTEKHNTAGRRLFWKKSFYLCVIVNIHYIDRSVTVTYKKKSVFFRLQDF